MFVQNLKPGGWKQKKMLKIVESKEVVQTQWLKAKKLLKNLKPAIESKKGFYSFKC